MSRIKWSYEPFVETNGYREIDVPIQYSISYGWGTWHVSETAHAAYGLIPLTPNTQPGFAGEPLGKATSPPARIFLVTPGELDVPPVPEGQGVVGTRVNKKGVEFFVASGNDKDKAAQFLADSAYEMIQNVTGLDAEEVRQRLVEVSDVPLQEHSQQSASQYLMYSICASLANSVPQVVEVWKRVEVDREAYRAMARAGSFALFGTTLLTLQTLTPKIDLLATGMGAAYCGLGAEMARRRIKRHLVNSNEQQRLLSRFALAYGQQVASDIYQTYSSDHFNSQLAAEFPTEET